MQQHLRFSICDSKTQRFAIAILGDAKSTTHVSVWWSGNIPWVTYNIKPAGICFFCQCRSCRCEAHCNGYVSVGLLGSRQRKSPKVLSRVLSEIGVLSGVLPRVLFLLFCRESTLESALGNTPESTPMSESTLDSTRGALSEISLLGSLAGQQTRNAMGFLSILAACSENPLLGRKHPSHDVIFSGQNLAKKMPKIICLHDVLEPLKQALLASRDVIISSQICGSNLQKVFTLVSVTQWGA